MSAHRRGRTRFSSRRDSHPTLHIAAEERGIPLTDLGVDDLKPHIASPDVHINNVEKSLEMFFHGLDHDGKQRSLRPTSNNGLTWQVQPKPDSQIYLRIFRYKQKKRRP